MNPHFEKYFLGEMNAEETANLELELAQNPALREQFEQERAFFEALKNQMLRQKIEAALAETAELPAPETQNWISKNWPWASLALLVLLSGVFAGRHFFASPKQQKPEMPADTLPAPPNLRDTFRPGKTPAAPPDEPKKTLGKQPIAQAPGIEPHSLQNLRGPDSGKTPWADLVEKLWFAPLPASPEKFGARFLPAADLLSQNDAAGAFLLIRKLENSGLAANDTLVFLKGYCLMQLWEGPAARRSFEFLNGKKHPWQPEIEWYTGLCHLTAGEKREAVFVFEKIAAQAGHRYRSAARQALALLR